MSHRSTRLSIFLTGVVIIGAACSETSTPENTSAANLATSTTVASERSSDGVLHLGLLVPLTDPMATFGPKLVPIVETVVRIMNNNGGFNGVPIELTVRDEGQDPETAVDATTALIEEDSVDAVIGPFSSTNAPSVLPLLVRNGIAACSPSASSLMLDGFPDDGLFLRTVSSDAAIARKMVDLADNTGSSTLALIYPDDYYGQAMARVVRESVSKRRELNIKTEIPYPSTSADFSDALTELTADQTSVRLYIGSPGSGSTLLNLIAELPSQAPQRSVIITNDVFVDSELPSPQNLSDNERPQIVGVARDAFYAQAELQLLFRITPDTGLPEVIPALPAFTQNTTDCALVLWLSALSADSDDANVFKTEFENVANEGQSCGWFAECRLSLVENENDGQKINIDYDGAALLQFDPNGDAILQYDSNGDPVGRALIFYEFDADGIARPINGEPDFSAPG